MMRTQHTKHPDIRPQSNARNTLNMQLLSIIALCCSLWHLFMADPILAAERSGNNSVTPSEDGALEQREPPAHSDPSTQSIELEFAPPKSVSWGVGRNMIVTKGGAAGAFVSGEQRVSLQGVASPGPLPGARPRTLHRAESPLEGSARPRRPPPGPWPPPGSPW